MSDEISLETELNAVFVAPDRTFQGQPLAPYTEGSRLLCLQVRDEADSSIWFVWSFVFMHLLLAKDRRAAIRLAWDRETFREKLIDWIADKTLDDRAAASSLVASILDEASRGRVEVIPPAGPNAPPGNG